MSDLRSRGWDVADVESAEPMLCSYHEIVTEHLSSFHAMQISRQCPDCVAETRHAQSATARFIAITV